MFVKSTKEERLVLGESTKLSEVDTPPPRSGREGRGTCDEPGNGDMETDTRRKRRRSHESQKIDLTPTFTYLLLISVYSTSFLLSIRIS